MAAGDFQETQSRTGWIQSATCRGLSVVGSGVGMGPVPDGTNGLGPKVTSRTCNIIYGFPAPDENTGLLV